MKVKHTLTAIGVILSGVVCATGVFASRASAVTFEGHSDVQFTFGSVLTLTLTGTPTGYSDPMFLIDGLMQGTESLSNKVTATVGTNNSAGYTLSATVGGTDSGGTTYSTSELVSSAHTDKFTMIDDTSSSSLSAGEWGFTLSGDAVSPATPEYMTLDTATAKTINATADNAGTPASASYGGTADTDMWIGAYADSSQKAGSYGNVINFTATANIQMRTVTVAAHDANVATYGIVSVDGSAISSTTSGSWAESQILGINATCVSGKTFLGWGISSDFGTIANQNNAATTYTIGNGNVTLTAYCGTRQIMDIQDVTIADCTTDPMTVIDRRDGQEYVIQKLADNKCWMMTNLNLGAIDLTQDLTSENTNCATSGSTACVATNMSGTPSLTAANFNSYEKTSGTAIYTAPEYIPVSGNDTTMGTPGVPYGTLYNYCVASAGTICNSSNSSNASYDLCPAGWRLPTGGSSGEFQTLYNQSAYNSNANMRKPYAATNGGAAFALAGYFSSSTPTMQGSFGYYWSSTRYDNARMYYLNLSTSSVSPADNDYRYAGYSIRCVLK